MKLHRPNTLTSINNTIRKIKCQLVNKKYFIFYKNNHIKTKTGKLAHGLKSITFFIKLYNYYEKGCKKCPLFLKYQSISYSIKGKNHRQKTVMIYSFFNLSAKEGII